MEGDLQVDDHDTFGKYIASELRTIEQPGNRVLLKQAIMNEIYNFKIKELNMNTYSNSTENEEENNLSPLTPVLFY